MKPIVLNRFFTPLVGLLLLTGAYAQTAPPAPIPDAPKPPPKSATNPAPSVDDDRGNVQAKPLVFENLGKGIAAPKLKIPAGAAVIRQASVPFGTKGDTALLNMYKRSGVLFMDVFTSKSNQPWTLRNHLRVKSPLPLNPETMALTLRYLEPQRKKSFLIAAADDAGVLTVVLPKGFGGSVMQQVWLTSTAKQPDVKRTYDLGQVDSRGFVIVKSTLDGSGQIKPTNDEKFYVWNGKSYVPRKENTTPM